MTTPSVLLKQRLVIAFSCVLVGCAVGAIMPRLAVQSYPTNPTGQRWEQVCEETESNTQGAVNLRLRLRGDDGYEFVGMAVEEHAGSNDLWICFKRPATH